MWKRLHVKYPLFFYDFNKTGIFSTDFRERLKYQILSKSGQWVPSCSMLTEVQTDGHQEANSRLRNFANAPKNWQIVFTSCRDIFVYRGTDTLHLKIDIQANLQQWNSDGIKITNTRDFVMYRTNKFWGGNSHWLVQLREQQNTRNYNLKYQNLNQISFSFTDFRKGIIRCDALNYSRQRTLKHIQKSKGWYIFVPCALQNWNEDCIKNHKYQYTICKEDHNVLQVYFM